MVALTLHPMSNLWISHKGDQCAMRVCTSSIATTKTETTNGPNSSMVTVMGATAEQQEPQKCLNPSIWSILNHDAIHYVQWFTVCLTLFNTNVTCMHVHLHTYILSVWGSLSLTPSFFHKHKLECILFTLISVCSIILYILTTKYSLWSLIFMHESHNTAC